MSYRVIEASEFVEFVFCQRAWWLRREVNRNPHNYVEVVSGFEFPAAHQDAVKQSGLLRRISLGFIFIAVSIVVFWLVLQL